MCYYNLQQLCSIYFKMQQGVAIVSAIVYVITN